MFDTGPDSEAPPISLTRTAVWVSLFSIQRRRIAQPKRRTTASKNAPNHHHVELPWPPCPAAVKAPSAWTVIIIAQASDQSFESASLSKPEAKSVKETM